MGTAVQWSDSLPTMRSSRIGGGGGGGGQEQQQLSVIVLEENEENEENRENKEKNDMEDEKKETHGSGSGSGSGSSSSGQNKILFLDGLRGIATLCVVSHHSGLFGGYNVGALGVDIFFVLSSFLLTMIFEKKARQLMESPLKKQTKRQWVGLLGEYFLKRILRVYPLFMLVVFVLWLLPDELKMQYYMVPVHRPQGFDLMKTLMMHPRYRHHLLWSLPIEIMYYFVIPPLCMGILALGQNFWWIPIGPLYTWILYTGIYVHRDHHSGFRGHFPTFLAGSLTAILYNHFEEKCKKNKKELTKLQQNCLRLIEYTAFLTLVSLSVRGLMMNWFHIERTVDDRKSARFISLPVSVILFIEMLLPGGAIGKCFEWYVFRTWGQVSFSVYLLHVFVLYSKWFKENPNYYDRHCLGFGLSFLLAKCSYQFIELPILQLTNKLCKRLLSTGVATAPLPLLPVPRLRRQRH